MGLFDYHNVLCVDFIAGEIECAPKRKESGADQRKDAIVTAVGVDARE